VICDLTKQQKYGDFRNKEGHGGLKCNEHCDFLATQAGISPEKHMVIFE
jgi:ribonuclease HI